METLVTADSRHACLGIWVVRNVTLSVGQWFLEL